MQAHYSGTGVIGPCVGVTAGYPIGVTTRGRRRPLARSRDGSGPVNIIRAAIWGHRPEGEPCISLSEMHVMTFG